jgi:hypothetical protein
LRKAGLLGPVRSAEETWRRTPGEDDRIRAQWGLDDASLIRLADDPEAVAGRIRAAAAGYDDPPAQMFVIVRDTLREPSVPPAARSALFRAAAYLPGVRVTGRARDLAGRVGVALSQERRGSRVELIFEPDAAAVLSEREVALPGNPLGLPAWTAQSETTYLRRAIVASITARPEGGRPETATRRRPPPSA